MQFSPFALSSRRRMQDVVTPSSASDNCCSEQGDAKCLEHEEVTDRITELKLLGVSTFVVGLPGSEAFAEYLDEFAREGGRPNQSGPRDYYAVDPARGTLGLTSVFEEIQSQLLRPCRIPFTESIQDRTKVNLAVDCRVVPATEAGPDGDIVTNWYIDEALLLEGDLCERVQMEPDLRLNLLIGCPSIG